MVRTVKDNTQRIHRYDSVSQAIADFKQFQDYHNFRRKLKVLQNRTPYEKMIEWYEKKKELFLYHPAILTEIWKERGET
jgi:hypothetical protein